MSRLEELHHACRSRGLAPEEAAECAALLADPAQRRAWHQLTLLAGVAPQLRRRRRRRVLRLTAWAVAAVLVLGLGAWLLTDRVPAARIIACDGSARLVDADGGERAVAVGMAVAPAQHLHGAATLELADGSTVAAEAGSELAVLPEGRGIELPGGRVAVHAAHQAPGSSLAVRTPHGVASVVGTRFQVDASADATVVAVSEGLVRLAPPGAPADAVPVELPAGTVGRGGDGGVVRLALPPASWRVDGFAGWHGTLVPGGIAPALHHQVAPDQTAWMVNSPSGAVVRFGSGLDLHLTYDLPQPVLLIAMLGIAGGADGRDFRCNLRAAVTLEAGTGRSLVIPASALEVATDPVRLGRGDECVNNIMLLVMDGAHGLVVRSVALAPAAAGP